ncbi:GroES-like protein [Polychaeton citri CBS 116435]|uniref:GroES-like protein n=1 Tax=Polychaeton citri CBS 116435 TaxID=1314669 RepID=A0A9P4QAR1_9PEZI|nr:GroES-like protein [Polychaeton citri CBS 116435]
MGPNEIPSPLPKTMRALVHESKEKPMAVQQIPTPEAIPGTVVVKVLAAQVDANLPRILNGEQGFPIPQPFTPGARSIGRVAAIGQDTTALKIGQLVMIEPMFCARDEPGNKALFGAYSGVNEATQAWFDKNWRHAAYAEYTRTPLENTWALNEKVLCHRFGYTFAELSHLTVDLVAFGGLRGIHVEAGETVIVGPASGVYSGAGVDTALALGANVVAVGRNETVLKRIQSVFGADRVQIVPLTNDLDTDKTALLEHGRADCFIDMGPPIPIQSSYNTACASVLRDGGRISIMGGMGQPFPVSPMEMLLRNLTIKGQFMYEPCDVRAMIRLVEAGRLKLGKAAGHTTRGNFKLDEVETAFDYARRNKSHGDIIVLEPWRL